MDPNAPYQPRPQEPQYVDRNAQPQQYQPAPQQPLQTPVYGEQPGAPQQHDYSFIMNTGKPTAQKGLPGGNSMPMKLLYGLGLLLVVLVILAIGRSLLSGGNNFDQYIGVAASQQAMIQITADAQKQQNLPAATQEFVYTAQLGLTSNQQEIVGYLATQKKKVGQKQLLTKISPTTAVQLKEAESTGSYDETMRNLMRDSLTAYRTELQSTYNATKGPNGRKILSNQYNQAGLLLKQLDVE